ncbi:MAG: tRNA (guanosine(37)-N1)-methyltransferase TrmD [Clostridia bacterium]|nr:tRNA (guanosine(37)-N1)-methyltransferase TrmD [Clostridia bacterium]MBQ2273469.1 tRNA (guanosine(37)-N1)-methyltransferase TrmD [Clostridia bacterium]MBQ5820819.1 tRNA (guanosine(37)-N1)-methyltransferase TrmD [Clostridia bacterium]
MRFDIMTLFDREVSDFLHTSILGRAIKNGIFEVHCHNIRDYTEDKQKRVDDAPYGGGMGMVMQAAPIRNCFDHVCGELGDKKPHVIYMTPKGKRFTQSRAKKLLKHENIVILCGHYEGVDQRILDSIVDEELTVGDYVLTGGELPAMIVVDAVARMIEGVLSDPVCYKDESIYSGLLEHPHYSRPEVFEGVRVPEILLSGHHAKIEAWRKEQSLQITKERRPDLYRAYLKKEARRAEKERLEKLRKKKERRAQRNAIKNS